MAATAATVAVAENGLKSAYKATDRPRTSRVRRGRKESLILLLLQLSAAVVTPFGRRLDVASAVSVGKFSYIQIGEFNCPKQYLFT